MNPSPLFLLQKRRGILRNPKNWDWVVADPVVNFLSPTLHLLEKEGYLSLSPVVRRQSEELYWNLAAFWIRREQRLSQILQRLEQEEIDVIPLKGAALLESIYKRIGVRYMGDVDLLVRDDDYIQTSKILLDLGMQPKWGGDSNDLFEFIELPQRYWPGELSYFGPQKLNLDLHRDLVTNHWFKTGFPVDMDEVWERSTDIKIKGVSDKEKSLWQKMLSPYHMLAHMSLHIALDGLGIMKNFLDVDLWLRNLPEDWSWNQYLNLVNRWKMKSVTYHVFSFCQAFFDTPIPAEVIEYLKPNRVNRNLVKLLISPKIILENRKSLGRRYPTLVKFALFDGISTKWDVIVNLIFPDQTLLQSNPKYRNILDHWAHIYQVIIRGD